MTLSATDNVGVTGYYASETSTTPSASASGWTSLTSTTSYSANVSFTLSSSSGTKTVYVWFKDAAGNVSASASDSITLTVTSTAYEIEPNNSFSDAQLINADTDYIGEYSGGGENSDYFKINATGGIMTVGLTHLTQNAGESDYTVDIYTFSQSLADYVSANDGVNSSKTIGVTSGQTYYIIVYFYYAQDYYDQSYQYKLKVSFS